MLFYWILAGFIVAILAGFAWWLFPTIRDPIRRCGRYVMQGWQSQVAPTRLAYLNDLVAQSNMEEFSLRAKRWKRIADFSFYFAVGSVVIGILIFIFADRIAVNQPELLSLEANRAKEQEKLDQLFSTSGTLKRQQLAVPQLFATWSRLHSYLRNLPAHLEGTPDEVNRDLLAGQCQRWNNSRKDILNGLASFSLESPSRMFTEAELIQVHGYFDEHEFDFEEFQQFIKKLFDQTEVVSRETSVDSVLGELFELKKIAESLERPSENVLNRLESWKDEVEQALGKTSQSETQEVLSTQQNIRSLDNQIAKIKEDFNPNNLYSVIPLLVVRLGAVILLIFLTQILLAVYRYNASMSTFYDSLADSIRLVSPNKDGEGPSREELIALIQTLNPKDYSYNLPESPLKYLTELAKNKP